jgi:hypothetical protein
MTEEVGLYLIAAASPLDNAIAQPTSTDDALIAAIISSLQPPSDSSRGPSWASDLVNAVLPVNASRNKKQPALHS